MAKLPQYQQQVTRSATQAPQLTNQNNLGEAVGQFAQGVSQLQAVRAEIETREAKTYAIDQKNKNTIEFSMFEAETSRTAKSGGEYLDSMTKWMDSQKMKALESSPNKRATEFTAAYFDDFSATTQGQIISNVAAMNATKERDVLAESIDLARTSVYLAPETYNKQAEYLAVEIENSGIPEMEKQAHYLALTKDLNRSRVLGEIQYNPHGAVDKLMKGNEGLSSSDHEAMFAAAIRAKEATIASALATSKRIDAEVAQLEKEVETETAKNGYELASTDDLDLNWILTNRENLNQTDYKFFLAKLESPDSTTKSNVHVYSSLYSDAASHPASTIKLAHEALVNGELTIGDFNKINTLATQSHKGELPSSYKQATTYLRSTSRTNELNPPVGAGERFANANDDFNMWYAQNETATPQEAVNKAKEIWADYRLIEAPAILSQPRPYAVGKNKSDINIEDLSLSAKELKKSYNNGTVSEQEYLKQRQIIINWKRSLEDKQ